MDSLAPCSLLMAMDSWVGSGRGNHGVIDKDPQNQQPLPHPAATEQVLTMHQTAQHFTRSGMNHRKLAFL